MIVALALNGCGLRSGDSTPGDVAQIVPGGPVRISVSPNDGATGVAPNSGVTVRATSGKLGDVALIVDDGSEVTGQFSEGRASWRSDTPLDFDQRYTVRVEATGTDGRRQSRTTSFTTADPRHRLHTAVVPLDGEKVGVGLPIQVQFSSPVRNRSAVEQGLTVESAPPVTGAWRWIGEDKVRFRPKEFWSPGTSVTLKIRLRGVDAGNGVYGDEQRDIRFNVGRSVVSVVDAKALRMTVKINGKPVRRIPVTTGKKGWETRNGIKVALEKYDMKVMDGRTVGIPPSSPEYYRLDVPWAVRMTWSGEFVHGADWSTASQGRARVSHGCVGMNLKDARWFYNLTRRGDVIKVVNSPTNRTMELDNGFGDWNLTWKQWQRG